MSIIIRFPSTEDIDVADIETLLLNTQLRKQHISWGRIRCRMIHHPSEAYHLIELMTDKMLYGLGTNTTGIDNRSRKAIMHKYMTELEFESTDDESYVDQDPRDVMQANIDRELALVDHDVADLRRYRGKLLEALKTSCLFNEVVPSPRCPEHGDPDAREYPLHRDPGCTCGDNPMYVRPHGIENWGLGSQLSGRSRGWTALTKTVLSQSRRPMEGREPLGPLALPAPDGGRV